MEIFNIEPISKCPNCGGEPTIDMKFDGIDFRHFVHCPVCMVSGSACIGVEAAISVWNFLYRAWKAEDEKILRAANNMEKDQNANLLVCVDLAAEIRNKATDLIARLKYETK